MTRQADRWLSDQIRVFTVAQTTDVNPTTGAIAETETGERYCDALIQELSADRQQNGERTLGLADRLVSLPVDAEIVAGERVQVTRCSDLSLVLREGTVTDVERDSLRARRRVTVRFDSND